LQGEVFLLAFQALDFLLGFVDGGAEVFGFATFLLSGSTPPTGFRNVYDPALLHHIHWCFGADAQFKCTAGSPAKGLGRRKDIRTL